MKRSLKYGERDYSFGQIMVTLRTAVGMTQVELAELTRWIVQEHCRVVTLLGMGGIGKSTLVSFLGQHLAPQFEAVLWRSVRDAPSCEELVADCITFFSETPPAGFPRVIASK